MIPDDLESQRKFVIFPFVFIPLKALQEKRPATEEMLI